MKALSFKEPWLNSVLQRMLGLPSSTRKAIIKILEEGPEPPVPEKKKYSDEFWGLFGAWDSDETAEELAASIRNARTANPDRDPL